MVPWLDPNAPRFPDTESAMAEPDGLLAAGGALDARFMVAAYSKGIFPWFSEGEPILWWSPSQRAALEPSGLAISRSLSKTLRNKPWSIKFDENFDAMVDLCSKLERHGQKGTWIGPQMRQAYAEMHRKGLAHSVEAFYQGQFCGGLFGVKLGGMFYGESMGSLRADASKAALAALCLSADRLGVSLIDCQMMTPHLANMGASPLARLDMRARIAELAPNARAESWVGLAEHFSFKTALRPPESSDEPPLQSPVSPGPKWRR